MTRFRLPMAIFLHLFPGALLFAFAALAGPLLDRPVRALPAGVLLIVVPVELGLVLYAFRRGLPRIRAPRQAGRIFAISLAASLVGGAAVSWLEPLLRETGFAWSLAAAPGHLDAVTVALWVAGPVLAGPIAEEIYFRGWLQPRTPGGPVVSCALFAVYHLWQPYAWLTVFVVALPLAWARTRGGVVVPILVHCTMNALTFAALAWGALQR
ncbi:CPBP family intramembrane glutamic endopeptidase [Herbidospora yilanensis]|uniref:CPBP family intramembrane glutamic endopeptidase n=1 Tax=Herbidospora yilanensis TaxID=354426 RepID=UPI000780EFED|nr:type II CAAX endopeptidase family protein [Herbidospora yilanensis]